jgi:hypothetical protein
MVVFERIMFLIHTLYSEVQNQAGGFVTQFELQVCNYCILHYDWRLIYQNTSTSHFRQLALFFLWITGSGNMSHVNWQGNIMASVQAPAHPTPQDGLLIFFG